MNKKHLLWFLILFYSSAITAASLDSLAIRLVEGKISVAFSFSGPYNYKVFSLSHPDRIVVDLATTTTRLDINKIKANQGVISRVRFGHPSPETLRIVFDVKHPVLPKTQAEVRKLQIFFQEKPNKHTAKPKSVKKSVTVEHLPPRSLRDVVIVLDPGHGGKDPGAIGPRRHAEKDVVLAIALKLQQIINKQPGMKAVLTRTGDHYVELRKRLDIARKYNADIFISIHADAFINQQSQGASVFALSPRGATSEAARWLAEKENYSELGGVDLSELDDQNGLIRSVLIDLSQTATIAASLRMGERVLQSLDKITNLHNGSVEQARFVVLKSPDIPSILVETGFISNPNEEKNLTSFTYQKRLTQAIFAGIKAYFWEYPPTGTRLEAMLGVNLHVVKKNETLQTIADRYHTTVASLKALNQLPNDQLQVGQKLTIAKSWS